MRLSPIGEVAQQCWLEIPKHFDHVTLDEFIVMPNHVHGIIIIHEDDHSRGVQLNAPAGNYSIISPKRKTLSVIVRTYKAAVTTVCGKTGHFDFQWQRSYYEHVIRNERASVNTSSTTLDSGLSTTRILTFHRIDT